MPSFSSSACTRRLRFLTCDWDYDSCCSTIVTTEARIASTTKPILATSQQKRVPSWDNFLTNGTMANLFISRSILRQICRSSPITGIEGSAAYILHIIRREVHENRHDLFRGR